MALIPDGKVYRPTRFKCKKAAIWIKVKLPKNVDGVAKTTIMAKLGVKCE
jgi:hypothetical protein